MKSLVLISVLFFFMSTINQAQENKFSFKEEYKVSSPAKLEISTSDGDIQVIPGEEGIIEVFYIVHKGNKFMNITKEELETHLIIEITHNDNLLDISVENRNKVNFNWNNQYNVSFEIHAPTKTSCYLKSSDGDIKLSGLDADQKCRTSDGDIRIKKINGHINLRTSDGDINAIVINGDADMQTSDGDINAESIEGSAKITTSDGDISINSSSGATTATTSDGDIIISDYSGSLTASTSDGDIRGNFVKIKNKISLVTSDGDISISIPDGSGFDLKIKGETLKTPKMKFSGTTEEHYMEGKVNGGGIPVKLITSDGTIALSYSN